MEVGEEESLYKISRLLVEDPRRGGVEGPLNHSRICSTDDVWPAGRGGELP